MSATPRQYKTGQTLFKEGDSSRSMYLIKKGSVSVRKMKGTAFVEIARIYHNEVLGELSFFDRRPRSATAVATSDVEALEIEFASLDKSYDKVPEYIKSIIVCVAERLRKANETIRRLQKHVIEHEEVAKDDPSDSEASDILAATKDIDFSSLVKKGTEGGTDEDPG